MPDLTFPDVVTTLRTAGCVYAEDEARLLLDSAVSRARLEEMIGRRVAGEPLEYVVGWAEFCGLRIVVEPTVFVPRRRTEFLVQTALPLLSPGAVAVDLGCGSGAIGKALMSSVERIDLYAVDIEPAAVRCARRNLGEGAHVFEGDLYAALPETIRSRVNLLAVNAPYVPSDEVRLMPTEARLYEARVTLDGGPDGLDIHRRVTAGADEWLSPGGCLLIETSERQAPDTVAAFLAGRLETEVVHDDELGATVVIGRRP